jgi:UDP-glucuronate decarboxylase
MKKNILIAGGAGFLGSHLCDRILEDGHNVVCLDNLSTGSEENISHLSKVPNFTFIEHDIVNSIDISTSFDQIYNLACPASPINYQIDRIQTIKTNVLGVINLLEVAKVSNSVILQASTSEIYGDPEAHPQLETYWGNVNPIGPRSCYDEGKRCAETLFFDYHRQENIKIKVMRIFNTYGPRMQVNDGRVVSNFINQALKGKSLTIYGDGNQTRSFCYVDDLINGMYKLMQSEESIQGPINIGNPVEFTMNELADKIIAKLPYNQASKELRPLPQDDPRQRKPDITLAKELLDWTPKTSLDLGLDKTIKFFQEKISE